MADKHGKIEFQDVERPKVASHDSTVLDLAFAMDCTSSMSSYISQAQQVGGNSMLTVTKDMFEYVLMQFYWNTSFNF